MFFSGGAKRKNLPGHALKKWQESLKSLVRSLWRLRVILLAVQGLSQAAPLRQSRAAIEIVP